MTTSYAAHIELTETQPTNDRVLALMDALATYHPAVGISPRGYLDAQITVPAESLAQAITTAVAVVEAAAGVPALRAEVMTEAEFDAREGYVPMPDLVSITEFAELMGITRQRAIQMVAENKLTTAQKVGKTIVIARSEAIAKAAHRFDIYNPSGSLAANGREIVEDILKKVGDKPLSEFTK